MTLDVSPDMILATKLNVSRAHPHLVVRKRLTTALERALTYSLTLISAPAGFGKTVLLGNWATQGYNVRRVAWLTLDENDNNLLRFITYFVMALRRLMPGIGETTLKMIQAERAAWMALDSAHAIEPLIGALINDLAGKLSEKDVCLVLDAYHTINLDAIHTTLAFLLDHIPSRMHLIIASRVDPPLPLARLRARGQLAELRADDLRFDAEEARQFMNETMALGLDEEDTATLNARAEGWITGLQLAALSLRGGQTVAECMRTFTGTHRHIVDYLTEEVLNRQPEHIQSFLMQTAILSRLSESLCQAVTRLDDTQALLTYLEQANLFTMPLDNRRAWYRYHQLFADFLRDRLYKLQPSLASELHRRAAAWYAQNGMDADAIDHALAAADFVHAARLIEQHGRRLLDMGLGLKVIGWLDALPDDLMRARPTLCFLHAGALLIAGRLDRIVTVETRLQAAAQGLVQDNRGDLAEALPAIMAFVRGDVSGTIESSHPAFDRLLKSHPALRGAFALNVGEAYWLKGDTETARQFFNEAVTLHRAAGNVQAALLAVYRLAHLQTTSGQLRQATLTLRQALQWGDGNHEDYKQALPVVALVHTGLSALMVERNDLEAATYHADHAVQLGQTSAPTLVVGYIAQARALYARRDFHGALEVLAKGEAMAKKHTLSGRVLSYMAAFRTRLKLAQGHIEAAAGWMRTCGLSLEDREELNSPEHEFEALTLARVLIARHRNVEAVTLLNELVASTEATGRLGRTIESLVLLALASDLEPAMRYFEQALLMAEPEGYIRTFLEHGEAIAPLLRQATVRDITPEYTYQLLLALSTEQSHVDQAPTPTSNAYQALPVPLSSRELEVLHLIAQGLSNQEIASRLVVTLETIKWHVKNIYRKLGVASRTQGIVRAKELKLL